MKVLRKVKEGHAGAYNSSLLDAAAMELFPGEEHMRDERGSSVSLCHLSQRALGMDVCRFFFCSVASSTSFGTMGKCMAITPL